MNIGNDSSCPSLSSSSSTDDDETTILLYLHAGRKMQKEKKCWIQYILVYFINFLTMILKNLKLY